MTTGTPPAEVEVDEALVAALVADQHPRYAGLPVRFFEFGWDNFTYRLGDDYCVRLPRRRAAVDLLANEQRCLPALAARLPLPVPSPIALGRPGRGFPWIWSIVPWIEGASADLAPPDSGEAPTLAAFLRALHEPASDAAPVNPMRGVSLAAREERMAAVLARLKARGDVVTPGVERAWAEALQADASSSLLARALGWAVLFGATIYDLLRDDDPRHAAAAAACLRRVAEDV